MYLGGKSFAKIKKTLLRHTIEANLLHGKNLLINCVRF